MCEEALGQVLQQTSYWEKMNDQERSDWPKTMAARLRNMLRHAQQSKVKKVAWFMSKLAGNHNENTEEIGKSDKENLGNSGEAGIKTCKEEADDDFVYGFDHELWKGWRMKKGSPKQYSSEPFAKPDAREDDEVFVQWKTPMQSDTCRVS